MTDARGLSVQLVALKVLADRVSQRAAEVKTALARALDPGDRKTAALDDGTKVGTVTYTNGRAGARVVDDRAFAEWVLANYPDEVVPQVRASFRDALLGAVRDAGEPVDPRTGEVIPGVEPTAGTPYVSVRPDPSGTAALVDAIRANQELALALEKAPEEEP